MPMASTKATPQSERFHAVDWNRPLAYICQSAAAGPKPMDEQKPLVADSTQHAVMGWRDEFEVVAKLGGLTGSQLVCDT